MKYKILNLTEDEKGFNITVIIDEQRYKGIVFEFTEFVFGEIGEDMRLPVSYEYNVKCLVENAEMAENLHPVAEELVEIIVTDLLDNAIKMFSE